MSKNIKVIQDGVEKKLSKVEKIQTYLANGNICNWVPEDEYPLGILTVSKDGVYNPAEDANGPYYGYSRVNVTGVGTTEFGSLAEITITKNGKYIASGDSAGPFYGYSKVIVNVDSSGGDGGGDGGSHSVPGKDPDGDDAVGGVDDDGNIVIEKLPTRISISVYPNNLVYEDGQLIDFTGLKVKAFLPNDTEWGIVDDDQLIKPVKVAEWDGSSSPSDNTATLDGVTVYYAYDVDWSYGSDIIINKVHAQSSNAYLFCTADGIVLYAASKTDSIDATYSYERYENGVLKASRYNQPMAPPSRSTYGYNGNNYQYYLTNCGYSYHNNSTMSNWQGTLQECTSTSVSEIAKILFEGEHSSSSSSSQQTIPLQWKRPGDGKILETSFTIAVHGSDDSGDSGGGSDPEPAPS